MTSAPETVANLTLTTVKILLRKLILVFADVIAFALAGCLAASLAEVLSGISDGSWLATQDIQRYVAWAAVLLVGLLLFWHYSDRKPFLTELGELLTVLLVLAVLALTRWNASRLWWGVVMWCSMA